jgi:hypothetical protein
LNVGSHTIHQIISNSSIGGGWRLNPSGPSKFCFTGAGGTQRPRLLHVVWTLDSRNPHHCFPVDGWVVCWQDLRTFLSGCVRNILLPKSLVATRHFLLPQLQT